jgi:hypothetical protein
MEVIRDDQGLRALFTGDGYLVGHAQAQRMPEIGKDLREHFSHKVPFGPWEYPPSLNLITTPQPSQRVGHALALHVGLPGENESLERRRCGDDTPGCKSGQRCQADTQQ